ncbi:hypothetical protein VOLCADRAFT_107286 [Volvox carteri f. nagariensis]|uniref:Uncharacterized protein n=1 Tax=Volvox carteri f. nagariensis TaxID=3068 RepID=D8UD01_VOLCA|nr:uncharacterized protein VOLCADRAFT_107286 [Volvox carteri f. nagariensis]EFJ42430.1 hypothetical protein VOLCADRAFT_107286 [Volvox carteri f. nagariensis]|eukprot:XP_002956493.1 hypothetical protein VOLCADRAFT_107286 [Volvox carteri f. nagariensis]
MASELLFALDSHSYIDEARHGFLDSGSKLVALGSSVTVKLVQQCNPDVWRDSEESKLQSMVRELLSKLQQRTEPGEVAGLLPASSASRCTALKELCLTLRSQGLDARMMLPIPHQELVVGETVSEPAVDDGEVLLVEPGLREMFRIAPSTPEYAAIVEQLPQVWVGPREQLLDLAERMCGAMAVNFRLVGGYRIMSQGLDVPPWRRRTAVMSRWQLSHQTEVKLGVQQQQQQVEDVCGRCGHQRPVDSQHQRMSQVPQPRGGERTQPAMNPWLDLHTHLTTSPSKCGPARADTPSTPTTMTQLLQLQLQRHERAQREAAAAAAPAAVSCSSSSSSSSLTSLSSWVRPPAAGAGRQPWELQDGEVLRNPWSCRPELAVSPTGNRGPNRPVVVYGFDLRGPARAV